MQQRMLIESQALVGTYVLRECLAYARSVIPDEPLPATANVRRPNGRRQRLRGMLRHSIRGDRNMQLQCCADLAGNRRCTPHLGIAGGRNAPRTLLLLLGAQHGSI